MSVVRDVLAAHLLRGKHRATVVLGNKVHTLDSSNPAAKVGAGSLGSVDINYDGLKFFVSAVSGKVSINNIGSSWN